MSLPLIISRKDLRGKRVIVRASLDVPIEDGKVINHFRVTRAMPTLRYLMHEGARIVLMTHVGRDPQMTLEPLYEVLRSHMPLTYVHDLIGSEATKAVNVLKESEVVLLENLRSDARETENDPTFGKELAALGDIYVNDAFAVSHRAHASVVGIPSHLESYVGLTFEEEYERLHKAMRPSSPSLFILGGAKFETKQPLVKKYLQSYDHIFIGGALANDFFKAAGYEVGESLVSDNVDSAKELVGNKKIILPSDVIVESSRGVEVKKLEQVASDEKILDVGPETVHKLRPIIEHAKTILWNGPVGNYENGFADATKDIARLIASGHAYSVVGGGDTIAAIESLGLNDKFSFLSTAGGAMLEYLEFGTLPGIEAIKKSAS